MKPFTNCAVDFAGPYLTVQGRGKVRAKRYLCLFLCLQTHCCHLEMAWSLDTDGFLSALTRIVARRGWPRDMLSDSGTNFIGGSKEIRQLVDQIDHDKIHSMTSNKGNKWHCNPPAAPHFGGIFERMIRSAKRAKNALMGNADVNDKELLTVFTGVESLINSRPLTPLSGDPNDEPVLTPNHLLIGQMGGKRRQHYVKSTKAMEKNSRVDSTRLDAMDERIPYQHWCTDEVARKREKRKRGRRGASHRYKRAKTEDNSRLDES